MRSGKLQKLVDLVLRQVEGGGILAHGLGQAVAGLGEPFVHGMSLVSRSA